MTVTCVNMRGMEESVRSLEPLFGGPDEIARSAKQIALEVVPMEWAVQFNFDWHSQLPETGGLQFGDLHIAHALTYDRGVYGVAIWTRPVAGNRIAHPVEHMMELRRYAIPEYAPKYTATRGLGLMRRWFLREQPAICRLLSYQMTDVHNGTIYKAANWRQARVQVQHESWTSHTKRKALDQSSKRKALDQSSAPKVRWELQLRSCMDDPIMTGSNNGS